MRLVSVRYVMFQGLGLATFSGQTFTNAIVHIYRKFCKEFKSETKNTNFDFF
jgi:hypothetical protein